MGNTALIIAGWAEEVGITSKSIETTVTVFEVLLLAGFVYAALRAILAWVDGILTMPKFIKRIFFLSGNADTNEFLPDSGRQGLKLFLQIAIAVLISRVLIFGIGYGYKVILAVSQGYPAYGFFDSFVNIWSRWDEPHYIDVARDWYITEAQQHLVKPGADSYLYIVFFPLYPWLIRLCTVLSADGLNASYEFYFACGCILSNVFLILGAWQFYRLCRAEMGVNSAKWALAFFLLCPASFFYGLVYTEALFFFLSVSCYYYLRRQRYLTAGIFGALAAFTRSPGVLLAVPMVIEWCVQNNVFAALKESNKKTVKMRKLRLSDGACALIVPLGTLLYLVINRVIYGNYFQFLEYQKHWGQGLSFFISNLADILQRAFIYDANVAFVLWLPELLVILFSIFLLGYGAKRMRSGYLAYMFVYIIIVAGASWLLSGVRYFSALFPVYMLLGNIDNNGCKVLKSVLLGISAVSLVAMTIGFVMGYQIM